MANEINSKQNYSIEELVKAVNKQEDGLYKIPNSELTIADNRYFNQLDMKHQEDEKVLVLSAMEHEQDYFIVGSNEVKWTDNWSGEDEKIYRGNVKDQFIFSFDEEVFHVNTEGLVIEKKVSSPVFEIAMDTPNHDSRSNSKELER